MIVVPSVRLSFCATFLGVSCSRSSPLSFCALKLATTSLRPTAYSHDSTWCCSQACTRPGEESCSSSGSAKCAAIGRS